MNFNFNEVEVNEGPSYITPGVYDVVITEVTPGTMPWGDNIPSLTMSFKTIEGNSVSKQDFNLDKTVKEGKEKSMFDWSQQRIKHIGTKVMSEEEFNKITSTEQLTAALVGKQVRLKFTGREYMSGDGTKKVATELGFSRFAEAIDTTPSRLSYDPNNQYDYKKLAIPAEPATSNGTGESTNLPF